MTPLVLVTFGADIGRLLQRHRHPRAHGGS
jgi:hypothetical protein